MRRTWVLVFILLPMFAAAANRSFAGFATLTTLAENNTSATEFRGANVSKIPIAVNFGEHSTAPVYARVWLWLGDVGHMNVGYSSSDPARVKLQIADMSERGIQAALLNWRGAHGLYEDNAGRVFMQTVEQNGGTFRFAIEEDLSWLSACEAVESCNPTEKLVSDLRYVQTTFATSPAYLQIDGRPAIFFSSLDERIDWHTVAEFLHVPYTPARQFNNSGQERRRTAVGTGETDRPARSGLLIAPAADARVSENCGNNWLSFPIVSLADSYRTGGRGGFAVVPWNDYEHGLAIEAGVNNCVTLDARIRGGWLGWELTGNENTIDHYEVYASLDGEVLIQLAAVPTSTHSLDLAQFGSPSTHYLMRVRAVGKPSFVNAMSEVVVYSPLDRIESTAPLAATAANAQGQGPQVVPMPVVMPSGGTVHLQSDGNNQTVRTAAPKIGGTSAPSTAAVTASTAQTGTPAYAGLNTENHFTGRNNFISTTVQSLNGIRFADQYPSIQAAIDEASASGGGTVILKPGIYTENITMKSHVTLKGGAENFNIYNSNVVRLNTSDAAGATPVITVQSGATDWTITDLIIYGRGSGRGDRGIYIPNSSRGTIKRVGLFHLGEEGIRWESGLAVELDHVYTGQCVLNRQRATYTGSVFVGGTDGRITYSELGTSSSLESHKSSPNLYVDALVVTGANTWIESTVLEISDMGLYTSTTAANTKMANSRVEFNYGHGALIAGSGQFINNIADTNGMDADNTYDGFKVTAGGVMMVGNKVSWTSGWALNPSGNQMKYGFEDTQSSENYKNVYVANTVSSGSVRTAPYKTSGVNSASVTLGDMPAFGVADGVATPDVGGKTFIYFNQSTPTTITNFVNGLDGQQLYLLGNANITLQHNGTAIYLANAADETLEANRIYHLLKQGGAWYEMGMPKKGLFNGGLDANSAGITNAGAISGATTITASGAIDGASFKVGGARLSSKHLSDADTLNADTVDGVHAGNVANGHVMCWKDSTHMGFCSSGIAVDGSCTCN